MALLTTISANNRIDEQGNTYDCETRCIGSYTDTSGWLPVTVYQWDCEVVLTKSYKYVGLTEASAVDNADDITNAYKKFRNKTVSRWDKNAQRWVFAEVQNVEEMQAFATPRQADGNMWEISVSVTARAHRRFNSASKPTIATLEGWVSDVANYPELQTGGA